MEVTDLRWPNSDGGNKCQVKEKLLKLYYSPKGVIRGQERL